MEDKREIVCSYVGKGLRLSDCLQTAGMSKSSYSYRRNYRTGGRHKTTSTKRHGEPISDDLVVSEAKALLSKPFIDYGYRKVATYLKRAGYEIGKKKVYRLMSEHNLIQSPKIRSKSFDKEIIKQKPKATRPLQIIEIDIKYVYIDEENRNAYLITIFDVFHRQAYNWTLNYNITGRPRAAGLRRAATNARSPSWAQHNVARTRLLAGKTASQHDRLALPSRVAD